MLMSVYCACVPGKILCVRSLHLSLVVDRHIFFCLKDNDNGNNGRFFVKVDTVKVLRRGKEIRGPKERKLVTEIRGAVLMCFSSIISVSI